ncbi:MAG: recombinase family protein, partial [Alphaproteobacteria bacterium]|nr:recombinase family protein [Alphaproteobacteria bacterium]
MRKKINNNIKPIETLCLCRVSSDKQAKKETIVSQKQLCLNYAQQNGFIIDTFFYEEAVSGWKGKRPGLLEMCDYMTANLKNKRFRVLFYDISRVARNMLTFSRFEALVIQYGVEWRTVVNGTYKNTAIDRFMWRLDAINAQRFSEELSEKTRNAMRSLMTLGYYPLNPPLGLKRQKDEHNKVILVRDEPKASIIAQMFEKYASGEITTKHALANFLNSFDVWNWKHLSDTQINDMLHNDVYTGVFAYDWWEIPRQEWKMDKLIPADLFNRVQERLNKDDKQPYKSNIAEDFPLRHEIVCELCGQPLTGY